jgi:hypothetical protein
MTRAERTDMWTSRIAMGVVVVSATYLTIRAFVPFVIQLTGGQANV